MTEKKKYVSGGFERETVVLESLETAREGQVRRIAHLSVLSPQQQYPDANFAQSAKLEGQRY